MTTYRVVDAADSWYVACIKVDALGQKPHLRHGAMETHVWNMMHPERPSRTARRFVVYAQADNKDSA